MANKIVIKREIHIAFVGEPFLLLASQNSGNIIFLSLPKPCINLVADKIERNAVFAIINAPITKTIPATFLLTNTSYNLVIILKVLIAVLYFRTHNAAIIIAI